MDCAGGGGDVPDAAEVSDCFGGGFVVRVAFVVVVEAGEGGALAGGRFEARVWDVKARVLKVKTVALAFGIR